MDSKEGRPKTHNKPTATPHAPTNHPAQCCSFSCPYSEKIIIIVMIIKREIPKDGIGNIKSGYKNSIEMMN